MINNYELLILNYIFNALHDFNSPYSINIGLALINLKQNRKVPIKGTRGELWGVYICLLIAPQWGARSLLKGSCWLATGTQGGMCQEEWKMDVNSFCVFECRGGEREMGGKAEGPRRCFSWANGRVRMRLQGGLRRSGLPCPSRQGQWAPQASVDLSTWERGWHAVPREPSIQGCPNLLNGGDRVMLGTWAHY